jgi:hypothetical protein
VILKGKQMLVCRGFKLFSDFFDPAPVFDPPLLLQSVSNTPRQSFKITVNPVVVSTKNPPLNKAP